MRVNVYFGRISSHNSMFPKLYGPIALCFHTLWDVGYTLGLAGIIELRKHRTNCVGAQTRPYNIAPEREEVADRVTACIRHEFRELSISLRVQSASVPHPTPAVAAQIRNWVHAAQSMLVGGRQLAHEVFITAGVGGSIEDAR